jgi:hypothetical protein
MLAAGGCLQGCHHGLDWCRAGDGGTGYGENVPYGLDAWFKAADDDVVVQDKPREW